MKVAILTPRPDYSAEWRWAYDAEAAALTEAGAEVTPVCWSVPVDAADFDLVLPLVAWGYHQHFDEWLRVLDRFEQDGVPVRNPVPLLRWNSDKSYLAELYHSGIPTVPTEIAPSLDDATLEAARKQFGCAELVVKPLVSASAYRTYRLRLGEALPKDVRGSPMMVQPWLGSIETTGEWSLIFFGGRFSHAVSKVPRPGEFRVQPEYGGIIRRCAPPAGAQEVALAALAAAPAPSLYARVDLVTGNDGSLQVIELELIEPAFFLAQAPDAASAFGRAVASLLKEPREQPLADGGSEIGRRRVAQPLRVEPGDKRI